MFPEIKSQTLATLMRSSAPVFNLIMRRDFTAKRWLYALLLILGFASVFLSFEKSFSNTINPNINNNFYNYKYANYQKILCIFILLILSNISGVYLGILQERQGKQRHAAAPQQRLAAFHIILLTFFIFYVMQRREC